MVMELALNSDIVAYTDQHHATFDRQSVRWRAWNHGVVCAQSHQLN